jgi:hypothetical protein
MNVEKLSASDWIRFKAIRLASLQDSPDAFGSIYSEEYARPDSDWISQVNDLLTFIGMIEGKDLGIVRVAFDDNDRKSCWLLSMWVSPSARGKGLGDLLIRSWDGLLTMALEKYY